MSIICVSRQMMALAAVAGGVPCLGMVYTAARTQLSSNYSRRRVIGARFLRPLLLLTQQEHSCSFWVNRARSELRGANGVAKSAVAPFSVRQTARKTWLCVRQLAT